MRAIILVAALAMAASFTLTWVAFPFAGPDLSPATALRDGTLDLSSGRWQTLVFLGGFALAALAAALALFGSGGYAFFGLLAGLTPLAVGIDAYLRFDELQRDLNLPFDIQITELADAMGLADDFLRLGVWAYLGGAAVLLLGGLSALRGR